MSDRLPILMNQARAAHEESQTANMTAAERALAAGAALVEAKALCQHGQWAAILAESGIPERTAQRYMMLHRAGFNSATVADLTLNHAEQIAGFADKLWPGDGAGKVVAGTGLGGTFWAVIIRHGESAFYAAVRFSIGGDCGAETVTLFKPIPRLFPAQIHSVEMHGIPVDTIRDMTAQEAEGWLGAVGAKMVRHSWGTRLEAGA